MTRTFQPITLWWLRWVIPAAMVTAIEQHINAIYRQHPKWTTVT